VETNIHVAVHDGPGVYGFRLVDYPRPPPQLAYPEVRGLTVVMLRFKLRTPQATLFVSGQRASCYIVPMETQRSRWATFPPTNKEVCLLCQVRVSPQLIAECAARDRTKPACVNHVWSWASHRPTCHYCVRL